MTLLIVNSDDFPPTAFDTVFKAAGLDTLSYAPPSASIPASQWPTLGSMIDSGKRLVTFLDASADFNSVNYLIDGQYIFYKQFQKLLTKAACRIHQCLGDRLRRNRYHVRLQRQPHKGRFYHSDVPYQSLLGRAVPRPANPRQGSSKRYKWRERYRKSGSASRYLCSSSRPQPKLHARRREYLFDSLLSVL